MLLKSLGLRYYQIPKILQNFLKKIVIFKKIKNDKIWTMNISCACLINNFLCSKTLAIVVKIAK